MACFGLWISTHPDALARPSSEDASRSWEYRGNGCSIPVMLSGVPDGAAYCIMREHAGSGLGLLVKEGRK